MNIRWDSPVSQRGSGRPLGSVPDLVAKKVIFQKISCLLQEEDFTSAIISGLIGPTELVLKLDTL